MSARNIVVLCGGVGAARFLAGLQQVVDPATITAVVNTGDDTVLNGLAISPDLDTITYTLSGAIDTERGWGLAGETWQAMEALTRFQTVKPGGSDAAATWFALGDRDLATHLYRTQRRAEGASLTTVTDEIRSAFGVAVRLLPMTDEPLATELVEPDGTVLAFQEYFVARRHDVTVASVHFTGSAMPTDEAVAALEAADVIVIAPSNPIVSVGPIRSLPGIDELLRRRRSATVAISPIVGGRALKGPAERLLRELGHEPTVVGVARIYADVAGALVIDPVDAEHAGAVTAAGLTPVVAPSVMSSPAAAADLARTTLAAAG